MDPLKWTASIQLFGWQGLDVLSLYDASEYQVNWDLPPKIESNSRATDAHICVSGSCCGDSGADGYYVGTCAKSNGTFNMHLKLFCDSCGCSDRKFYFNFGPYTADAGVGDWTKCFSLPAPTVNAVEGQTVSIQLAAP